MEVNLYISTQKYVGMVGTNTHVLWLPAQGFLHHVITSFPFYWNYTWA